jgi:hypothetical protein
MATSELSFIGRFSGLQVPCSQRKSFGSASLWDENL